MSLSMTFAYQEWPYRKAFRIARETRESSPLFVVYVTDGEYVGRGECGLQSLKSETREGISQTLSEFRDQVARGATREALNKDVAACSARNAVDCALWDLECKQRHTSAWSIAGINPREEIEVDLTIGIGEIARMQADAVAAAGHGYRTLKIKADATNALEAVDAIHRAVPRAKLIVDANESWTFDQLKDLAPRLGAWGVCLIEQPLHHDRDAVLSDYDSPVPICADESCATREGISLLEARYDAINIKLDKTGGLSEAVALALEARKRGLRIMVGCNGATSLGIAPAYIIGTLADWRDLDSAALLIDDRAHPMQYQRGMLKRFDSRLWG